MYCTSCGMNNPDHAAFCARCGAAMGRWSGPTRQGREFVVPSRGASLPAQCCKCGKPSQETVKKTYWWHEPTWYFLLIVSPVIYLIVAVIVRKRCNLQVPVCEDHRRSYRTWRWTAALLMLGSVPLWIACGVLGSDEWIAIGALLFLVAFLAGAITFSVVNLLRPTYIDDMSARFRGAGEGFLRLLPG